MLCDPPASLHAHAVAAVVRIIMLGTCCLASKQQCSHHSAGHTVATEHCFEQAYHTVCVATGFTTGEDVC
jgi:hypothetical protein